MAFFEKKDTGFQVPGVAECDAKLAQLEGQKREVIYRIGLKYAENNSAALAAGTIFEEEMNQIQSIDSEMDATEVKKLALQGMRKCEECGNVLVIDSLFCNKCGVKLAPLQVTVDPAERRCPKCGNLVESGAAFCVFCGNQV